MKYFAVSLLLLLLFLVQTCPVSAQLVKDSSASLSFADSLTTRDSIYAVKADTTWQWFTQQVVGTSSNSDYVIKMEEGFKAKEQNIPFYISAGLFLLLGIIRVGFSKYYADMVRIFGQTTFRQKSIREQLVQNPLAGLLMNIFFVMSGGFFLYQLTLYFNWQLPWPWWKQLVFCVAFLATVYLVKYIGLQISGYLFGMGEMIELYTFMVFLLNKMIGIIVLPAAIVLALGASSLKPVAVTLTLSIVFILFVYRYIIALPLLRQYLKIIPMHFFLYFCAFEILPVLLVYKWILNVTGA